MGRGDDIGRTDPYNAIYEEVGYCSQWSRERYRANVHPLSLYPSYRENLHPQCLLQVERKSERKWALKEESL